jgi:hypothetical protein
MNVLEVRDVFSKPPLAGRVESATRKKLMSCHIVVFAANHWPEYRAFLYRERASLTEAREEYGAFMVAKSVTIVSRVR